VVRLHAHWKVSTQIEYLINIISDHGNYNHNEVFRFPITMKKVFMSFPTCKPGKLTTNMVGPMVMRWDSPFHK
jgi:hypothetical protein